MKKFRYIDHTGDIGILVFGESVSALFAHAAEAFFHIITEPEKIRTHDRHEIVVDADGLDALMVGWLNEFLYLFDTQTLVFKRFLLHTINDRSLKATAFGEILDEKRHPIKTTIKAVTYHQLRVWQENGIWRAQVIFDL